MTKRIIAGCFALILVVALMMGGLWYDQHLAVKVPTFPSPAKTIWLRQNWTAPQRSWFRHADQGTLTLWNALRVVHRPRPSLKRMLLCIGRTKYRSQVGAALRRAGG
jgi:hypothetical protein